MELSYLEKFSISKGKGDDKITTISIILSAMSTKLLDVNSIFNIKKLNLVTLKLVQYCACPVEDY